MENQHQAEQTGFGLRDDTRGGGGWRLYQRRKWQDAGCALDRWRIESPNHSRLGALASKQGLAYVKLQD